MSNFRENFGTELADLRDRCKVLFEADPSQAHTDAAVQRFLRAFGDADEAFKAIIKCNKWRREFGVPDFTEETEEIKGELGTGTISLLPHRDLSGRPILYIATRKHDASKRDIQRVTKFIVYMLERACACCKEDIIDNLCIVFDLKDFSMSNMDYQFVKNLIWLLSKYYPERLGVCLIINAPMIFYGCWAVIRPWLNDVTAKKVTFVGNGQVHDYVPPGVIPSGDDSLGSPL